MKLKNIWNNIAAVAKDKSSTVTALSGGSGVLAGGAVLAAMIASPLAPVFAAAGAYTVVSKIAFGALHVASKKKNGPKL